MHDIHTIKVTQQINSVGSIQNKTHHSYQATFKNTCGHIVHIGLFVYLYPNACEHVILFLCGAVSSPKNDILILLAANGFRRSEISLESESLVTPFLPPAPFPFPVAGEGADLPIVAMDTTSHQPLVTGR